MNTSKFTLFFGVISFTFFLFGVEYGTITGKVIDGSTGRPIIGADVVIDLTNMGAPTDTNGEFNIQHVPADTYTVIAGCIAYVPRQYDNIVVNGGDTIVLQFSLSSVEIIVHGHPVIAVRPMMIFSETQSVHIITAEEIERLPVTTIDEIIELQPGVTKSDFGIHIRGGDVDEIVYYFDGIATKVPYTDWQYNNLNLPAIEAIEIISGGFDVEYGDVHSGIVNIFTKRSGNRHRTNFYYLGDEIFSGDKLNFGYNQYNFSLGGPIPMVPRLRYFFSGELMFTDAFQEALYKIPSSRNDYHIHGNIAYIFPNARGKLTISGFKSREQYVVWSPYSEPGNDFKYFNNRPMTRTKNWIASAALDYMLGPKTLTSLKIGVTHFDRAYGNRDYDWEEEHDRKWYDDYRFKAEHLINYLLDEDYRAEHNIIVADILIDSLVQYHEEMTVRGVNALRNSPYGIEGIFYTYGDDRYWTYWHNNDIQVRFKLIHSLGKFHELKTGIDFFRYDIKYYSNELPWFYNPFWSYFERTPYKFAGYLQDKMNVGRVIARVGVRGDYFNPGIANEIPIVYPLQFDSLLDDSSSFKISPRIGISLWVTNRMKLRFNYGHFYQFKPDISIELQKATMFEFGYEHQLLLDMLFGLTAYVKNSEDYYNIHGLEFILHKRMWAFWSLTMSYNLQYAKGPSSWYPGWGYYDPPSEPQPTEYWLDYDERHTFKVILNFEFPHDYFLPLQNFGNSITVQYHSGQPYTLENLLGYQIDDTNSSRMPGYWNVDWKFSRRVKIGPTNLVFTGLINNLFNTTQIIDVYNTTGEPDDHGDPDPGIGQFSYISISSPFYSPQADYNHDGLITPVEFQKEYITARNDLYDDHTNYNNGFRMRLGVGIEF